MLTSLISSAVLAMSSQVYIAKFNDLNTELKAKISLHHALLKSSAQGTYFDLTQAEANLLRDNGALLIQANSKWQSEYANLQKRQTNTTNLLGIPGYPCYDTVEGTLAQAKLLSETYPELTEFIDIGDSWQKQQLGSG